MTRIRVPIVVAATGILLVTGSAFAQTAATPPCPPGCTPIAQTTLSPAARRAARERARLRREAAQRERDAAQAERDAQRAAINHVVEQNNRLASDLDAERTARTRKDAEHDALLGQFNDHLVSLQQQHDELAATAMRNRYIHENRVMARGGGPPPVDSAGFYRRPRIEFAFEGGGMGYTDSPINDVYKTGGMWGLHVGVAFANWLALETRYLGSYNPNVNIANTGLLLTGGSVDARLMAPIPYIHPYGFAGVGLYNQRVINNANPDQVSAAIDNRTALMLPVGGGIDIPITPNFSVGAEGAYHYSINNTNADPSPRSSLWTASGLLRLSL